MSNASSDSWSKGQTCAASRSWELGGTFAFVGGFAVHQASALRGNVLLSEHTEDEDDDARIAPQ